MLNQIFPSPKRISQMLNLKIAILKTQLNLPRKPIKSYPTLTFMQGSATSNLHALSNISHRAEIWWELQGVPWVTCTPKNNGNDSDCPLFHRFALGKYTELFGTFSFRTYILHLISVKVSQERFPLKLADCLKLSHPFDLQHKKSVGSQLSLQTISTAYTYTGLSRNEPHTWTHPKPGILHKSPTFLHLSRGLWRSPTFNWLNWVTGAPWGH